VLGGGFGLGRQVYNNGGINGTIDAWTINYGLGLGLE